MRTTATGKSRCPEQPTSALTIADAVVWIGYPAVDFYPVFSDPTKSEMLNYEYSAEGLTIDATNNTITGLVGGVLTA